MSESLASGASRRGGGGRLEALMGTSVKSKEQHERIDC